MTTPRHSLLKSMLKSLLLPGVAAGIVGLLIVFNLVKQEYDELQDFALTSKAHLLLDLFEISQSSNATPPTLDLTALLAVENATLGPDERTTYRFIDSQGRTIVDSQEADPTVLSAVIGDGLVTAQGHRIAAVTAPGGAKTTVIVATPMTERNEAITDVLLSVAVGFVLLGLFFAVAAFVAVRKSVAVIGDLSRNIANKNEHDLSPIDRRNSFAEIEPAIDTLDTLMARLETALASERAFATNAAHELRTPLAVCLANVQRLKTKLKDPDQSMGAAEIEAGLKRLVRLIERLLQLSRAQSGLGTNPVEADINPVIRLMLKELRDREPSEDKLCIAPPTGAWFSQIDPDALGIILNNLFDNALKYASGPMPISVDASQAGRIVISNDCDALVPADLETIKLRFVRKATLSDGFGLGLSIVQSLCIQSGCTLEVFSPQPGLDRGFTAVLHLPPNVKEYIP